jgi:hypothetical protein
VPATTGIATYLEVERGLNANEAAVVFVSALKYDIADWVGTQVSVVTKLSKKMLARFPVRGVR